MWKVLVSNVYMQPVIDRFVPTLRAAGCEIIVPPVHERLEETELLKWVVDVDAVIAGDDRFTKRVMLSSPKLRVIVKWGTGIDSIDLAAAQRLGIEVYNTPNAFSEPVADSVLGYILCFARNLPWMDRSMKDGQWNKIPGISLSETTLGVIGVGNVGKAVLRRAKAFSMNLLGNDVIEIDPEFVGEVGMEMLRLEELLQQSDFVSLNCDLNPTSYHLIGASEFETMKPTAVLINAARGPIVDESALVRALEQGLIRGAALDVFEEEPLSSHSPLLHMDNVMLAPHNANSSPLYWERVHENTIHSLLCALGAKS